MSPDATRPGMSWPVQGAASLLALIVALAALLVLAVSGPGFQRDWWGLGTAFAMLRWGAFIGLAAALLGLLSGALSLWRGRWGLATLAAVAVLMGGVAAGIPYSWQQQARGLPPIHDITTDTVNPPAFVAIAPLRQDAPNPVDHAGEEVADAQRRAYPDIQPIVVDGSPQRVFAAALRAVETLGWELVAADQEEGRIEATDTTRWFGFKDDVVIRLAATDDHRVRVDARSKSRLGRGDAGTNARRIREFRELLLAGVE